MSPFFGTGQTLASLYCAGTEPDRKDDELEMLLSKDAADKGPGFGWTSPEQSNMLFNNKANSMAEKQVTISDTNLVFATVDFPSKISLEEVCM